MEAFNNRKRSVSVAFAQISPKFSSSLAADRQGHSQAFVA
jgi:hypothetical protein